MSFYRVVLAVAVILSGIALCAIFAGGAWRSDLGGDPDEPAHAVTSLMVRDYVVAADHYSPGKFAQTYYANFPKIALGHYPPFYYVIGALALLPVPCVGALMLLQAAFLAVLGVLVFICSKRSVGGPSAFCAALMTMLVPMMWKLSLHVMADLMLVGLSLLAVLCWVRFCERPTVKRSMLFGLIAALAILTKGSAVMLGAVPPLALVLRRQWPLLRSWSWWAASVPVLLLAAPWMALTAGITKDGMTGQTVPEFFKAAVPYYGSTMVETFGWFWLILAGAGLFLWVRGIWRRSLPDLDASLLALLMGGLAVILLIPAGLSGRYLAPIVPVMAVLALTGARGITSRWFPARFGQWAAAGLAWLAFALVLQERGLPQKQVHGFSDAVAFVQSQSPAQELKKNYWLVSSEARGEGAIIAEAAFHLQRRVPAPLCIYRAGKELASSDWMGRGYKATFATEAEVLAHLEKLGVHWVFVDLSVPEKFRVAHERLLETALRNAPDRWKLELTQKVTREPGITGDLLVYQSRAHTGPSAIAP